MYTPKSLYEFFGVSKSQLALIRRNDPDFPKPIYLTPRTPRWPESDIAAYLQKKRGTNEADRSA